MTEIRLEPAEWNQVLQILANAPWAVANPLIMRIGEQLRAQASPESPSPSSPRPNSGEHKVEH
jgi:hypothetical protein